MFFLKQCFPWLKDSPLFETKKEEKQRRDEEQSHGSDGLRVCTALPENT